MNQICGKREGGIRQRVKVGTSRPIGPQHYLNGQDQIYQIYNVVTQSQLHKKFSFIPTAQTTNSIEALQLCYGPNAYDKTKIIKAAKMTFQKPISPLQKISTIRISIFFIHPILHTVQERKGFFVFRLNYGEIRSNIYIT